MNDFRMCCRQILFQPQSIQQVTLRWNSVDFLFARFPSIFSSASLTNISHSAICFEIFGHSLVNYFFYFFHMLLWMTTSIDSGDKKIFVISFFPFFHSFSSDDINLTLRLKIKHLQIAVTNAVNTTEPRHWMQAD